MRKIKSGLFCAKASNFNPLKPDLFTLYRQLNPINIWPTYAVPQTTTLYPRSSYDLLRAESSPTIKLHSHQTPDQPPLIPDQFLWLGRVWSGKKLPALIEERIYPR